MVDIVVDSILEDGHEFFCHVAGVDTDIEGYLKLHEIVPYNIEGLHLTDFRDSEGNPLRLRAEVLRVRDDGYYDFTLLPYLREYTRETCDTETVFDCRLFKRLDAYYDDLHSLTAPGYVGISSYGDSVLCLFNPANDPGVQSNEVIEASFDHVSSRGQIVCRYIGPADPTSTFTHTQAFARLLSEYNAYYESGIESISDDDDENEPQDSMLDVETVRELIRLIDRVATLEESKVRMFNYLAFCRLLGRLIGDESVADYYKRRMSFLDRLKTFLDSGYIDVQTLRLDEDGYMDYPRLQKEILQLKVLSYFNYPDRNDELWKLSTTSDKVSRLAKLALLSNLSLEFKFTQEIREQINSEVSRLLSIPLQLPSVVTFGEESQTIEFKSSYICPADSLRPDPDRQRDHILQRICGFLNSESGGTLYIGVNNYGVASGLDEDMKYFHSRDRFDLRVRNDIRTAFGTRVNSLIDGVWADDMFRRAPHRKDVYRLRIRPCSDPVSLSGYYWLRQGTSTYTLELAELRQIMSDRNRDADTSSVDPAILDSTDTSINSSPQTSSATNGLTDNTTPAASANDNVNTTQTPEATFERFAESFSVGRLRPNPCHDWEENYVVPHCFIHFYGSDGYEVSQQASYETYRSLAVQEHERTTTLVAVYGDGTAIAVPFEEFDEKDRDHRYSRYRDKPLAFACLGHPSDKLLIIYSAGHMRYARLEDIGTLRSGSLTDTPQALTTADFDEVIACELVPLERTRPVRTLLNVSSTSLG
ncbi:MAG: ATP-binding protein, partial [Muribaculaceae bacterium]|nr:ATP-binding protein [Muribaculaceae bacterium]